MDNDNEIDDNDGKESSGRWTREEHNNFVRGLELYGKGWKKIASLIKTRTVVQVRTHAQKYFLKIAKARQNGDLQTETTGNLSSGFVKKKRRRLDPNLSIAPSLRPFVQQTNNDVDDGLYHFLSPALPPESMPSSSIDYTLQSHLAHHDHTSVAMGDLLGDQMTIASSSDSYLGSAPIDSPSSCPSPSTTSSSSHSIITSNPCHSTLSLNSFGLSDTNSINKTQTTTTTTTVKPLWFNHGRHVGELLQQAEEVNWMLDAGCLVAAAGGDSYPPSDSFNNEIVHHHQPPSSYQSLPSLVTSPHITSSHFEVPMMISPHTGFVPVALPLPHTAYPSAALPLPPLPSLPPSMHSCVTDRAGLVPLSSSLTHEAIKSQDIHEVTALVQSLSQSNGMTIDEYLRRNLEAVATTANVVAAAMATNNMSLSSSTHPLDMGLVNTHPIDIDGMYPLDIGLPGTHPLDPIDMAPNNNHSNNNHSNITTTITMISDSDDSSHDYTHNHGLPCQRNKNDASPLYLSLLPSGEGEGEGEGEGDDEDIVASIEHLLVPSPTSIKDVSHHSFFGDAPLCRGQGLGLAQGLGLGLGLGLENGQGLGLGLGQGLGQGEGNVTITAHNLDLLTSY